MKFNFNEMMENIATKFGSFCRKMKEDNQENITKINNFFLNLKENLKMDLIHKKKNKKMK